MKCRNNLATLLILAVVPLGAIAAEQSQTATGAPATAQTPTATIVANEEPAPLFEQLDLNQDGYVTPGEARRSAEVTARFRELDGDRDGRISTAEFRKGMQPKY